MIDTRRLGVIAGLLLVACVAVGVLLWQVLQEPEPTPPPPVVEPIPEPESEPPARSVASIGASVEGRSIEAYQFGDGAVDLLFVGGIHGGYEWNSSLLAWQVIDYLTENPGEVPEGLTIHIIPVLNPDGLELVVGSGGRFILADVPNPGVRVGAGRFNANDVDLNRNFDCNWEPESTWRGNVVSAGMEPFSEPEAAALRDYIAAYPPAAVAFWHSQANNVYGSACNDGVLADTVALGAAYAEAGGYGFVELFDAYPVTGDVEGWLASQGIPAVTVELESFQDPEWERNWAGMQSWFEYYVGQDLVEL
jgi:hypothetical protein